MLKFEEVGGVETDADGNMLPGVYSIPGVGLIVVGENKETVILRRWESPIVFSRPNAPNVMSDLTPWADSKRLKLVKV